MSLSNSRPATLSLSYSGILLSAETPEILLAWLPKLRLAVREYLAKPDTALGFVTKHCDAHQLLHPLSSVLETAAFSLIVCTGSLYHGFFPDSRDGRWSRHDETHIDLLVRRLYDFKVAGHSLISIVNDVWSIKTLEPVSDLNVYVGGAELSAKHRNTIPLTGQGVEGACNLLSHAAATRCERLASFGDIVSFADTANEFYARSDAPRIMRQKATLAAESLTSDVAEVCAVFGTGYPFYVANAPDGTEAERTPSSILRYFRAQRAYFRSKVAPTAFFNLERFRSFTAANLRSRRLRLRRGIFDRYWYSKFDAPLPPPPPREATLDFYHAENAFDVEDDIWPCQLCTRLHDRFLFPDQARHRGFNGECLPCRQTSLTERNVMVCAADMDLIAVVDGDPAVLASRLEAHLRNRTPYFLHDTFQLRAIENYEPALDVFVVSEDALAAALADLEERGEDAKSLSAHALWVPLRRVDLDLSAHFALAFELLTATGTMWPKRLAQARVGYACHVNVDGLLGRLRKRSFYLRQLLGNRSVTATVRSRLAGWEACSRPLPLSD
jgi:hypothetical protein